ncbi:MAG: lipoyl synthase [Clostridia bacterium]|jgi:lipoic acid synthetase
MITPKPEWLKIKAQSNINLNEVEELIKGLSLNTVCDEAACPNRIECYGRRTATFMILGRNCTRNCQFCNVEKNHPQPVDENEPKNIAQAVKILNLKHVVITSVTRDDLKDGGASHFARVVDEIRKTNKEIAIEVLIPDFRGDINALKIVVNSKPNIIGHNIETVPRLFKPIRSKADYNLSLELLKNSKQIDETIFTKSSIMLGLGETKDEVLKVFKDLRNADCDFLCVGQYLAPSKKHYPVQEYIHPDIFDYYKKMAFEMGFKNVSSGPLVRSSYQADKALENI